MLSPTANPVTGRVHLADVIQRPRWLQKTERHRHGKFALLFECLAEFMGVFFYTYCGVGATLAYNVATLTNNPGLGSLFTVGLAYALGIVFAVAICAPTSGGHFNPCVTIAKAVWHSFPWKKVPIFILAQIMGAMLACLNVFLQNKLTIIEVGIALQKQGKLDAVQFTPGGLAGAFGIYLPVNGVIAASFMNEFATDFFLGLIIWAICDPTNYFIPPVAAPWIVGLAYGVAIWNFAMGGLAANSARDIGGRLFAIAVWGPAASGGAYAVVAALTNIPAMLLATLMYESVFTDSSRAIPSAHLEYLTGHKAHLEYSAMDSSQRVNDLDSHNQGVKASETPAVQSTYNV